MIRPLARAWAKIVSRSGAPGSLHGIEQHKTPP